MDVPAALLDAIRFHGAEPERWWRTGPRLYGEAAGPGGRLFARYSTTPSDDDVFAYEAAVRAALPPDGVVRAPAVMGRGPGWMVERWVEAAPADPAVVVAATTEIAGLVLPRRPPAVRERWTVALRRRLSLPPALAADVVRARRMRRWLSLPTGTAHGDFHPGNVFGADGKVWVIDWELAGTAPVGTDGVHYSCFLERVAADELFEGVVAAVGARHRADLARLRYVRLVGLLLGARAHPLASERDEPLAARLLERLPDVRRQALAAAQQ